MIKNNVDHTVDQNDDHIVQVFKSGAATIMISDKYCRNTTPEEVDRILKSIADKTMRYLQQKEAAKASSKETA